MRVSALLGLCLFALVTPARADTRQPLTVPPGSACRVAAADAERRAGIPPALLAAIARVESGRADLSGGTTPWPWTINAEGEGHFYPTKQAAIAAVQALQARGVQSIDVGCMQVNLMHHPDAFPNLDAAFDPATNATYAAQFLNQLRAQSGSWPQAAALYHSATPALGAEYRARVMAAWPKEAALAGAPPPAFAALEMPVTGPGPLPMLPIRRAPGIRIIPRSTLPGTPAPRSLADYRARPIALAVR
jgi:hypothetical protein